MPGFRASLPPPTPTRPRKGGGSFGERSFCSRPLDGGGPGWGWDAGLLSGARVGSHAQEQGEDHA